MADYSWPSREDGTIVGSSPDRLDGLVERVGFVDTAHDKVVGYAKAAARRWQRVRERGG